MSLLLFTSFWFRTREIARGRVILLQPSTKLVFKMCKYDWFTVQGGMSFLENVVLGMWGEGCYGRLPRDEEELMKGAEISNSGHGRFPGSGVGE